MLRRGDRRDGSQQRRKVWGHLGCLSRSGSAEYAARTTGSPGEELAGTTLEVRIGAGVEGSQDAVLEVVVGELGEVLVGQVGGAVQLLRGKEAEDLGLLALAPGVDAGCCVVVGALGVHEFMVAGDAGGSLSIDCCGG